MGGARERDEEIGDDEQGPGDFETAVSATGYGIFNVLFLLATVPAGWTTTVDTSTITFIMPSAECDLNLNLFRKGALAAVTYAGMVCTAIVACFIADKMGRKYLLLFCLLLDAVCNILRSASPNFYVFLSFKFINGIVVGGSYAVLTTYIAEFHAVEHRSEAVMYTASLYALGSIAVPALATIILPLPWSFSLGNNWFVFKSWRIFLLFSSIPGLLGFVLMAILPESPKYLMTKGYYHEALEIFKKMYSMNARKSGDVYPIKALSYADEDEQITPSPLESASRFKSWFTSSYMLPVIIVNTILFCSMMGMHMMSSWRTQLMVILNNFSTENWRTSIDVLTICEKLDVDVIESFHLQPTENFQNATNTCVPMPIAPSIYTNAMITTSSAVVGCFLMGLIVNKVGKKNILLVSLVIAGACNFAINWSPSPKIFLVLASTSVALTGIANSTITAMIIEYVPTAYRATAVSLTMVTGRLGAATGNLLFPVLLKVSCNAPFYYIGGFLTLAFVLATFLSKRSTTLKPQTPRASKISAHRISLDLRFQHHR